MNHAGLRPIADQVCSGLSGFLYFAFVTSFDFAANLGAAFVATLLGAVAAVLEATFGAAFRLVLGSAFETALIATWLGKNLPVDEGRKLRQSLCIFGRVPSQRPASPNDLVSESEEALMHMHRALGCGFSGTQMSWGWAGSDAAFQD